MIPFANVKAQYESIKPDIDDAVLRVLGSGEYILGNEVNQFEREFAAYCGAGHAIAVSSGTSALHLALLAAGVEAGDEVITTPLTFVATVAAIGYSGARAVLADIDENLLTIDPANIERAITSRTKAIIPVHLYGQLAEMDAIRDIAKRHGLVVIEDAAQAHGAELNGKRAGSLGDIACFSFYPTKNLGAYGEGGIVTTSDPEIAERVRRLRDWGQERRSIHSIRGYNYRMDAIQGAVLRVKLRHLNKWNAARRERAGWYDSLLRASDIQIPPVRNDSQHSYHL
ncbi:MAG: DegT/DnrJ/EryC1/StrS family aminotransferase, partial [Chthoniobacterales bacterium]